MNNKVVLIGCGNVGMSYAFALLNQRTAVNELVFIDVDRERIIGEVADLNHGLAFAPSKINIRVGDYSDCRDATMVVIAAGASQEIGETRMDLIYKNSIIFKQIVGDVMKNGFSGIFLVASNPLDIMTYITWKYSGMKTGHVIGSGTSLDTARLRYTIGQKTSINPKNIHAYVMGEHGDSEFIPWSIARVGLENANVYLDKKTCEDIEENVKCAAYDIIKRKGSTCYGIGMCLVRITNAILGDEHTVIAVSVYDEKEKVYYGGPAILTRNGIEKKIEINLQDEEKKKLDNSIQTIKKALLSLEKYDLETL